MEFPALTPHQLGEILEGYRLSRKMTQAELGKRIGMAQSHVSRIEANPGRITVDRLYRVLSALDIELVLREKKAPPPPTPSKW